MKFNVVTTTFEPVKLGPHLHEVKCEVADSKPYGKQLKFRLSYHRG